MDKRQTRAVALLAGNGAYLISTVQWVMEHAADVVEPWHFWVRISLFLLPLLGLACAYAMLVWERNWVAEVFAIICLVGSVMTVIGYLSSRVW